MDRPLIHPHPNYLFASFVLCSVGSYTKWIGLQIRCQGEELLYIHFIVFFTSLSQTEVKRNVYFKGTINSLGARVKTSQPVSVIKGHLRSGTPERPSI